MNLVQAITRGVIDLALSDNEELLQELLSNLDEIVWSYSIAEHRILYVNDAAERIYGRSRQEFLNHPELWRHSIHPEDRELARATDDQVMVYNRAECDCRIVAADGRVRWLHFSLYRVGAAGERVIGVGIDISERKRAELALAESEELFHATTGTAQIGFFVMQEGRMVFVNSLIPKLFGYAPDEMIGMSSLDLTPPDFRRVVIDQMQRRQRGEPGEPYESVGLRKDGSRFPIMVLAAPTTYKGQPATVGTIYDLSERESAEKRIRELAFYDPVTGLPNRALLVDRFGQVLAEAERKHGKLALCVVDLDHFKRVNDTLGHTVGDQLLRAVAERIKGALRRVDTVARLGGDEFILLLPDMAADDAGDIARRLLESCGKAFQASGHDLTITPSIGISLYPDDGRDFETLLKNADAAMYQAKEAGRQNFQFYSHSLNVASLERLMLENSLRQAVTNQQFMLVYQPLVCLRSGRIVACEALIRWRHPHLGVVSPARFIPVAEDTGLINPIGDWVLAEAAAQAKRWQDEGLPAITMAINVSPVQFRQNGFIGMVAGVLASSGLDPRYLELEMTERTVMHDAEANIGTLSALHRMGVELAVDDFGTGYSSLAYLKRFPVGKLKIDRSFVSDIVEDADDLAIATTIVSIGHSLRLSVLAEGVEDAAQLTLLEARQCDLAQGYHFSLPVAADDFADLLRRQPFAKVDGKWQKW